MATQTKRVVLDDLCRKTFLHEGNEVKMTGRIAKRSKRSGENVMFEIRPLDTSTINGAHREWVLLSDMYEIFDTSASKNVELASDLIDAIKRVVKKNEDGNKSG